MVMVYKSIYLYPITMAMDNINIVVINTNNGNTFSCKEEGTVTTDVVAFKLVTMVILHKYTCTQ